MQLIMINTLVSHCRQALLIVLLNSIWYHVFVMLVLLVLFLVMFGWSVCRLLTSLLVSLMQTAVVAATSAAGVYAVGGPPLALPLL